MSPADLPTALDESLPDIDWVTLPHGVTRFRFAAPSGSLAAIEIGENSAQRVVLVPGVTGSKEDFWFLLDQLAASGYHVESFDLAGQYESAGAGPEQLAPPRDRYDYDLFVDDLIAFIERGQAPVHLLGYSFAGIVAELVVERRPDLVSSLTLLSTPPLAGRPNRGIRKIGWLDAVTSPLVDAALMKWGIVWNVQRVGPGRLAFVRSRFSLTRTSSRVQVMGLLKNVPDVSLALAETSVPKLIAVGSHDLWPLRLHREFAERVGATLCVYRTGHSPCETAPHQLSRDMLSLFALAAAERR